VHSYHVSGTAKEHGAAERLELDATADNKLRVRIDIGSQSAAMVATDGRLYVRANAAFWQDEGVSGTSARRLADRWVTVPSGNDKDLEYFLPATLAYCLTRDHGRVTVKGTRDFERRCDEGGDGTTDSDIHISDYDKPVDISAPPGAVDPRSLLAPGDIS
jgi:hypothetical protein